MGFSIKAAWNYKCPKCRQSDIFIKPINLKDPLNMPDSCVHCNQKTEPEIGFYYGAMMVSYGISVWSFLAIVLTLVFYFEWTVESAMVVVIFFCAVTYLKLIRFSRSLWLHMMEKHDPITQTRIEAKLKQIKPKVEDWKPRIQNSKSNA